MTAPRFVDFANLWIPLCPAADVPRDKPLGLALAGERVALFRDEAGAIAALVDRCPHRGVALSLGKMNGGTIACPFHGWRFAADGQCRHVPWNPDARLDVLAATALPVRELAGVIWLFTGTSPADEPALPASLTLPGIRLTAQSFDWQVHWTRVMENMLDTPHLPFVHARTIGKALRSQTAAKMEMTWHPTETGAEITARRAGEEPRSSLGYHFPNMMELTIDPGGRLLRMLAVCLPLDDQRTRLTIYTLRNFARSRLFDPLFARANARIAAEDRAIVESSRPMQVPPAGEERSVASDAPTLAFRKIWFTRIKDHKEP